MRLYTSLFLRLLAFMFAIAPIQEDMPRLVMALCWWGGLSFRNNSSEITLVDLEDACDRLMNANEEYYATKFYTPMALSSVPTHAKNAFCINIFCLDIEYQSQAVEFLFPAFAKWPDKRYCILTQPSTTAASSFLAPWTLVKPKPAKSCEHVLYLIHRDALICRPICRLVALRDLLPMEKFLEVINPETSASLLASAQEYVEATVAQKIAAQYYAECNLKTDLKPNLEHRLCQRPVFGGFVDDRIIFAAELEMIHRTTLVQTRKLFDLDKFVMFDLYKDPIANIGILHFVINPIFERYSRMFLRECLRLSGTTILHLQVKNMGLIPSVIHQLLQCPPRRRPVLKKPESPQTAAVEDFPITTVLPKRFISIPAVRISARIVVVGASDTSMSFLDALLAVPNFFFQSLTLLAPGGLGFGQSGNASSQPLLAHSAGSGSGEVALRSTYVKASLGIRWLSRREIQLHDGAVLPYDYLVLATGLQDAALHSLSLRSCGLQPPTADYRQVNGALSSADPQITILLHEKGTLIKSLLWNPLSYAVIYGRSLDAYCIVKGLLLRNVPSQKILIVLPPRKQNSSSKRTEDVSIIPDASHAFPPGDQVEVKVHDVLSNMGITIYENYRLINARQDARGRLNYLIFEDLNIDPATAIEIMGGIEISESRASPVAINECLEVSSSGIIPNLSLPPIGTRTLSLNSMIVSGLKVETTENRAVFDHRREVIILGEPL